jgi:hypothetical protein
MICFAVLVVGSLLDMIELQENMRFVSIVKKRYGNIDRKQHTEGGKSMKLYCLTCTREMDRTIQRGYVVDVILAKCNNCGFKVRCEF